MATYRATIGEHNRTHRVKFSDKNGPIDLTDVISITWRATLAYQEINLSTTNVVPDADQSGHKGEAVVTVPDAALSTTSGVPGYYELDWLLHWVDTDLVWPSDSKDTFIINERAVTP